MLTDDEVRSGALLNVAGAGPRRLAIVVQMAVTMVLHGQVESMMLFVLSSLVC